MARKPSRRSALSGNADSIFESRGLVDRKVQQKLNSARKQAYSPERLKGLMSNMRFKDVNLAREAGKRNPGRPMSQMQRDYITNVVLMGMNKREAAKAAGYQMSGKHAVAFLDKNKRVQNEIRKEQELYARAKNITRERVIDEMYEAYDMAKIKGDPLSMIAAVREVGKICGLYEPVKHKIEVSVEGQVLMQQLTVMSDQQLLELASKAQEALPAPIEGSFTPLPSAASTSALHPALPDEDE
jgi:hypothetical protein